MKTKTKNKTNTIFSDYFDFRWTLKMKVWNDNLWTLWHCNRDAKIMTIKSCDEFGSLQNKFKIGKYTHSHPVC